MLVAVASLLDLIHPRILEPRGLRRRIMLLHEGGDAAGGPILLNGHRHERRAVIRAVKFVLLGMPDPFCSQVHRYAILIVVWTVYGVPLNR